MIDVRMYLCERAALAVGINVISKVNTFLEMRTNYMTYNFRCHASIKIMGLVNIYQTVARKIGWIDKSCDTVF